MHTRRLMTARRLALGLLLFLTTGAGAEPLRVVTLNLQGMRPDSNWQVRLFFIVQRLVELDPDVICLQEVCETLDGGGADNQARSIAQALQAAHGGDYTWSFQPTHVGWELFNEGVGLVSRLPVLESGYQSLTPGTFPRKVVWHRLQAEDGELQVFSTHLDHLSDAVRRVQAGQVQDYVLETLAAHPGSAAVLGGDFNATPESAPIRLFTQGDPDSLFADAWASLHPGENGWTMPAEAPTARIDYLFSRREGQPWLPDSCRRELTTPYDGTHFPSDHFAVLADYTLESSALGGANTRPGRPELLAPYPNPFNPALRIPLELARPGAARLSIHDLLGREVACLHEGGLPAGIREIVWSPAGLAGGLYLVVLRRETGVEARRALYLP
ncbi:MAG: endonuclease/exonuclease/phosphatase family protein [Candidatus Delongbacteria bacterium]